MKKLRIRGHHIQSLEATKDHPYIAWVSTAILYNTEFATNIHKTVKDIDLKETEIEMVEGIDDICKLGCPYYRHCETNGEDESCLGTMGKYLKSKGFDPEGTDNTWLDYYGLKPGDKTTLEEILKKQ